jgi:hypothetical protein
VFVLLGAGSSDAFCKHGNQLAGFITRREILDQMSNYQYI